MRLHKIVFFTFEKQHLTDFGSETRTF